MRSYSAVNEYNLSKELSLSAMSARASRSCIRFPDCLEGLKILDIGSGQSDCLSSLRSGGALAIGIDPRYGDKSCLEYDMEECMRKLKGRNVPEFGEAQWEIQSRRIERAREGFERDLSLHPGCYIAALAGNLPFPDGFFDFAYSINTITHGLDREYEIFKQAVLEALRVVRHGSELQLYPFLGQVHLHLLRNHKKLLQDREVTSAAQNTSIEDVPLSVYKRLLITKEK